MASLSTQTHRVLPAPALPKSGEDNPPMVCRAIFEELFILANGDIVCASPDPTGKRVYGNVHRDRIGSIFNGRMYREIRDWQLKSRPDSWCPAIHTHCPRRVTRAATVDQVDERWVKLIELEPVSSCNLRCPKCPVTSHFADPELAARANQKLPLDVMIDIVAQLPALEKILFYGFGEPFLHQDSVPFLRHTKLHRPEVFIATSTNGLPFSRKKIEAMAKGAVVDKIVFAIDGVDQSSYHRYRIGGDVSRALGNLQSFVHAVNAAGNRGRIEVVWQYILFQWNDSDDEIGRAKALAKDLGIPIDWVATHSTGASTRYRAGSPEIAGLSERKSRHGTAEVRLVQLIENDGIAGGLYLARLNVEPQRIVALAGERIVLEVTVENRARKPWTKDRQSWTPDRAYEPPSPEPGAFRLGVILQTAKGKTIAEVSGGALPDTCRNPNGRGTVSIPWDVTAPPGNYRLLIDVVEEHICWFFERGSPPCICQLTVWPRLPVFA